MLPKIQAAATQFEHAEGDITANLTKVRTLAESAAEDGTQILVCPECCLTGYWFLNKLPRERIAELAQLVHCVNRLMNGDHKRERPKRTRRRK
jgi:predicted amidohydrolase